MVSFDFCFKGKLPVNYTEHRLKWGQKLQGDQSKPVQKLSYEVLLLYLAVHQNHL